jgi:hypothetical protein
VDPKILDSDSLTLLQTKLKKLPAPSPQTPAARTSAPAGQLQPTEESPGASPDAERPQEAAFPVVVDEWIQLHGAAIRPGPQYDSVFLALTTKPTRQQLDEIFEVGKLLNASVFVSGSLRDLSRQPIAEPPVTRVDHPQS